MSGGGTMCICKKRTANPNFYCMGSWVVTQRNCNHSAFNGYHETPSRYSTVKCLACGHKWRTKAAYVSTLPDEKKAD